MSLNFLYVLPSFREEKSNFKYFMPLFLLYVCLYKASYLDLRDVFRFHTRPLRRIVTNKSKYHTWRSMVVQLEHIHRAHNSVDFFSSAS